MYNLVRRNRIPGYTVRSVDAALQFTTNTRKVLDMGQSASATILLGYKVKDIACPDSWEEIILTQNGIVDDSGHWTKEGEHATVEGTPEYESSKKLLDSYYKRRRAFMEQYPFIFEWYDGDVAYFGIQLQCVTWNDGEQLQLNNINNAVIAKESCLADLQTILEAINQQQIAEDMEGSEFEPEFGLWFYCDFS